MVRGGELKICAATLLKDLKLYDLSVVLEEIFGFIPSQLREKTSLEDKDTKLTEDMSIEVLSRKTGLALEKVINLMTEVRSLNENICLDELSYLEEDALFLILDKPQNSLNISFEAVYYNSIESFEDFLKDLLKRSSVIVASKDLRRSYSATMYLRKYEVSKAVMFMKPHLLFSQ